MSEDHYLTKALKLTENLTSRLSDYVRLSCHFSLRVFSFKKFCFSFMNSFIAGYFCKLEWRADNSAQIIDCGICYWKLCSERRGTKQTGSPALQANSQAFLGRVKYFFNDNQVNLLPKMKKNFEEKE